MFPWLCSTVSLGNHEPLLGTEPPRSSTVEHTRMGFGGKPRCLPAGAEGREVRVVIVAVEVRVGRDYTSSHVSWGGLPFRATAKS